MIQKRMMLLYKLQNYIDTLNINNENNKQIENKYILFEKNLLFSYKNKKIYNE